MLSSSCYIPLACYTPHQVSAFDAIDAIDDHDLSLLTRLCGGAAAPLTVDDALDHTRLTPPYTPYTPYTPYVPYITVHPLRPSHPLTSLTSPHR